MLSTSSAACRAPRGLTVVPRAPTSRRTAVRARAEQRPEDSSAARPGSAAAGAKPAFMGVVDRMLTRYDFLSTGCGALAVTGYCVLRGQDPATAACITVTATVVALVANELLFADGRQQ